MKPHKLLLSSFLSSTFSSIAGAEKVVGWALSHHLMQNLEADPDSRVLLSSERLSTTAAFPPTEYFYFCRISSSNCRFNSVLQLLQHSIRDWHLTGYPE